MIKTKYRKWAFVSAASAIGLAAMAPTLSAQETAQRQNIEIAAKPLSDVITEISQLYSVPIIAADALIAGKESNRISGSYSIEQALSQALIGTDLTANFADNGGVIIQKRKPIEDQPAPARRAAVEVPSTAEEVPLVREPVIVFGTKQETSLQDTIASVAVITAEEIDQRALFDFEDVLVRTPNLTTGSDGASEIAIRGISSRGVDGGNPSRNSSVYVDGAPVSINGLVTSFNFWDLEQVEVLRGPQSTIQGRNALSGAILFITADPEYEYDARVRAIVADNNTYQGSIMVTGPIIEDQVAFRLAADYREQDFGILNEPTGRRIGLQEASTIRGKLLVEPNALPNLRAELGVQFTDFFNNGSPNRFILPNPDTPGSQDIDPFDRINRNPRIGDADNESLRYFADLSYQWSDNWRSVMLFTLDETERFLTGTTGTDLRDEDTLSLDSRLEFEFDSLNGWLGAYYFEDERANITDRVADLNRDLGIPTNPPGAILTAATRRIETTKNYAIYGDLNIDLSDRVTLNIGARYDWESITDTGNEGTIEANVDPCLALLGPVSQPCTALQPASEGLFVDTDYEDFLPRAAIIYSFDEDRLVSLSVAKGYRAGGVNPIEDRLETFDAETLINYELAFRSTWFDDRFTFNANAFYGDWTDIQIGLPSPGGITPIIINGAEAELYGAELSARVQVTPQLEVFTEIGLLETEFTDFPFAVDDPVSRNPIPGVPGFDNLAGNEFTLAPSTTASLGASYEGDNGVFGSFLISHRGEQFSDITNLPGNQTDSYTLVNGRVGYQFGGLRVSIYVENLFEEEFLNTIATQNVAFNENTVGIGGVGGFVDLSPLRTFGVELDYRF